MTKSKTMLFVLFLLVAGVIYFYLYKDSFVSNGIQISYRAGAARPRPRTPDRARGRQPEPPGATVMFRLSPKKYNLTQLKVVPFDDFKTNKYPHAIWHLISDSNSVPINSFAYGDRIRGMRPAVKGIGPDSLQTNVVYRLLLDAGSVHGERNFQISVAPAR